MRMSKIIKKKTKNYPILKRETMMINNVYYDYNKF
jgi:hypothetical protein